MILLDVTKRVVQVTSKETPKMTCTVQIGKSRLGSNIPLGQESGKTTIGVG
ncbi:hypothetical protein Hdeb2414_s0011g00375171 [Helianthus debilis subsp. tardiflorus]